MVFHRVQCIFFQPGYLCLGDVDLFCYLHLGFALKIAEVDNMVFALWQRFHGIFQRQVFYPVCLLILFVTDLIHDIKSIPALGVDWFVQGYRTLDGIQRKGNILRRDIDDL